MSISFLKGVLPKAIMVLALCAATLNVYADALEDIIKRGEVRIGVSSFEPWTMKAKDGSLMGFEVEVGKQLAQDMGVKPKFVSYEWDELMPAVEKGEIDVIAAGLAVTPQRALRVNFSVPYMDYGVTLATHTRSTKKIRGVEELNNKNIKIVAVSDSIGAEVANAIFPKATKVIVKTSEEAEAKVAAGDVHAMISSSPVARFAMLRHPEVLDMPLQNPLIGTRAAFGIEKGEEDWARFLDAWVVSRTADGWLKRAEKFWFYSLDWQAEQK